MIEKIINDYTLALEKRIDELLPQSNIAYSSVVNAARYSLLLGGKRIRPIILLEFCKLCGGNTDDAIDFAVALEMIHTYSLIHDDLPCMDDDDIRRGNPSCHIKYGEDIALLAGDSLLTEAFRIVAKSKTPCERIVKAVEYLSSLSGIHGMIGGQVLDLKFENSNPDADELLEMYSKKTSCLLIAASSLGCIAAGKMNDKTLFNAKAFALNLGLAFQIIDDILDCTADEKLLGKPIGSDEKNGKSTFITIYGLEEAKIIANEYTQKALDALNCFDGDKTFLIKLTNYLLNRKF